MQCISSIVCAQIIEMPFGKFAASGCLPGQLEFGTQSSDLGAWILVIETRSLWSGFVGSISRSRDFCLAASPVLSGFSILGSITASTAIYMEQLPRSKSGWAGSFAAAYGPSRHSHIHIHSL
nr:uncharacterized protein LOC123003397 [Drosophila takahashii]